jgi:PAS domain S-box-containing protein
MLECALQITKECEYMLIEMKKDDFIVSKTDRNGRITYANKIFMDIAGYTEAELLGKPHNIVRHEDMPKAVFKLLWERVQAKEEIFAYVLNKTKSGDTYWVYASVTASLDVNGNIIGYYSVRRYPEPKALEIIKPLYNSMVEAERSGGVEAGMKVLTDLIHEKGVDYDELIISLQE